jgi:hypothetical protein
MVPKLVRNIPLHQQVEEDIRRRIENGELGPGAKLPSSLALAKSTGTSVFTVQTALSRLHREGLVERKTRLGTFVKGSDRGISKVGIYFGCGDLTTGEFSFEQYLAGATPALLAEVGPDDEIGTPLPSLMQAIKRGEIQGLIGTSLRRENSAWLSTLPLRTAFLSPLPGKNHVKTDLIQMVELSLAELHRQGCRTVGFLSARMEKGRHPVIGPDQIPFDQAFPRMAQRFGLETRDEWLRCPEHFPPSQEQYGFQEFQQIWNQAERPDGLLAFPDYTSRGVVSAILARQIQIPQELKLILYANDLFPYPCPVPCHQVVTDVNGIIQALVDIVRFGSGNDPDGRRMPFFIRQVDQQPAPANPAPPLPVTAPGALRR